MTEFNPQMLKIINCQSNIADFFNNKDLYFKLFNTIIEICLFPNHIYIKNKDVKLFESLIYTIKNIVLYCEDTDVIHQNLYTSILNIHIFLNYLVKVEYNITIGQKSSINIIDNYNNLIVNCLNYIFNLENWDLNTQILDILYPNESGIPDTMENREEKKKFNLINLIRVLHEVVFNENEGLFNECLKNTIRLNMAQKTDIEDIQRTNTKIHKINHIKNFCFSYKQKTSKNIYTIHKEKIIEIFLSGESLSSTVNVRNQQKFKQQSVLTPVIFQDIAIIKPQIFNKELEPNFLLFLRDLKADPTINYNNLSQRASFGNNKDVGFIFEGEIERLLVEHGFKKKQRNDADKLTPGNFIQEPNGGGTYPDFHIVLNNHILEVEAKANQGSTIMFGSSIPKQTVLYLVLSPSADQGVTFMFGKNLLSFDDQINLEAKKDLLALNTQKITVNGMVNIRYSSNFSTEGTYYDNFTKYIENYVLSTNFYNTGKDLDLKTGIYIESSDMNQHQLEIDIEEIDFIDPYKSFSFNHMLSFLQKYNKNTSYVNTYKRLLTYKNSNLQLDSNQLLNALPIQKLSDKKIIIRKIAHKNYPEFFCYCNDHLFNCDYFSLNDFGNDRLDMYEIPGSKLFICHLCLQLQTLRTQRIKEISITKKYEDTQIVLDSTKQITGHSIFGVPVKSGIMFFIPVRYGNNDEVYYTNIIPNYNNKNTQKEIWSEILKYYLINKNSSFKNISIHEIKKLGDLEKWTQDKFIGSERKTYIQNKVTKDIKLQDIYNNFREGRLPKRYTDYDLQQIMNILNFLLHTQINI